MPPLSRRQFLAAPAGPCVAVALGGLVAVAATAQEADKAPPKASPKVRDKGPRLDLELVKQFVGEAHRDLDKVRALWEKHPTLLNASWDWGGGDWETALGGAAHTGRKNIVLFLLDKGARLDVFAAAVLGKLEFVKAAVAAFPGVVDAPGPHGIPLLAHAKAGKEDAAAVVQYLESLKRA
jgi:hypothetical protein